MNGRVIAIESGSPGDYAVSLSPGTLSLAQGSSGNITVTVTPSGGFNGSVTLSVPSGLPTGVTASFSPTSVTVGAAAVTSTLTLTANATATTGNVSVPVQGAFGATVRSSNLSLTTTPPQDFTLTGLGSVSSVVGGAAGSTTATITGSNGFNGNVTLSASGLPSGVTVAYSVNPVTGGSGSSTLTFAASSGAATGTSTITVTATNTALSLTRTATFSLTVNPAPSFTLTVPGSGSVTAASSNSFTVSTTAIGGFNSAVALTASGAPVGVTVSFSPASITGSGSSTMTVSAAGTASPGSYPLTITGTSTSPSVVKTAPMSFAINPAQQSVGSVSVSPAGAIEVTLAATANDPTGASHILSTEFTLSTATNSNSYPAGQACAVRVTRTGASTFALTMMDSNGSGWMADTRTPGQTTGTAISNGVCSLNHTQSTVTQSGNNLAISVRIARQSMSGVRYVRSYTTADTSGGLQQPYSYTGASWNVPVPSGVTFSNSQGVTPPVIYPGYNVTITMSVSNLGSQGMALKLAQASDGSVSYGGTNPLSMTYTAGNSGEDRDVIVRGLVCSSSPCNEAAGNSNVTQEYLYTVRVMSSASSPPSLNFTNPFTGSPLNPSLLNTNATANGTATTFLNFGIRNYPYAAAQCTYYPVQNCTPIQNLYLNINNTFTESALSQDRVNGCRLNVNVYAGGSPPGYYFFLTNDAGTSDTGFMWTPAYGGGSYLENSQCRVNIQSSVGAYAAWPSNDITTLGIGLQYIFKTPFVGKRYIFMMGNRNSGDWSGWQYRGYLNLQ